MIPKELRRGLEASSDLNKDPSLYKRGGKIKKRRKRKGTYGGTQYGFGGTLEDIGKLAINTVAAPWEGISGQNFVNFNYNESGFADAAAASEGAIKGATDVAGTAVLGPAYGGIKMGASAIGSGVAGVAGGTQQQRGASDTANAIGSTVQGLGSFASNFVTPGASAGKFGSTGFGKAMTGVGNGFGGMDFNPMDMMKVGAGQNTFAQGGMMNMIPAEVEGSARQQGTPLQMQKGELLTHGGKVLRNFIGGATHYNGGFDISAPEGTIVIPKNKSQQYMNSGKKERKMMEQSLVSQQARRESNFMRKGGLVRKYQQGGTPNDEILRNLNLDLNKLSPEEYNQLVNSYGYSGPAPMGYQQPELPIHGTRGYHDSSAEDYIPGIAPVSQTTVAAPNVYPGAPNTATGPFIGVDSSAIDAGRAYGNDLYSRSVTNVSGAGQGTGFEIPAGPFPKTSTPGNGVDLGGWQKYASAAPLVANAIDYFQKPEQLDPKEFEVGQVGYHDQKFNREPFLRARASAANSLRNVYANSPGAYRSSIGNTYSGFASKEQEARNQIYNQNAQNRIGVDATNLQAQGYNKKMALEIANQNMANREMRRDAGRQFATNLGKFGDRQANLEFGFDELEGAYGDQPGYRDRIRKSRRKYTWG